ncbi:hypothetical protein BGZ52_002500 [Haplosporangium bisporale]|nr:hypothetical protein BGZ52_002500 [Haplosporangium bisporale]
MAMVVAIVIVIVIVTAISHPRPRFSSSRDSNSSRDSSLFPNSIVAIMKLWCTLLLSRIMITKINLLGITLDVLRLTDHRLCTQPPRTRGLPRSKPTNQRPVHPSSHTDHTQLECVRQPATWPRFPRTTN